MGNSDFLDEVYRTTNRCGFNKLHRGRQREGSSLQAAYRTKPRKQELRLDSHGAELGGGRIKYARHGPARIQGKDTAQRRAELRPQVTGSLVQIQGLESLQH